MAIKGNMRRGQALVMVSLAALAMFGIIGLAVDLGWGFYVKRSAQAAADAAALAAVHETLTRAGTGTYVCGTDNVVCSTAPQPCPGQPITDDPANNIDNGCLYAAQDGFATGGKSGHQTVTMQSNVTSPPPTAPGVRVFYWVTARVSENIPQLFSRVLGRGQGTSSARATAAIAETVIIGSLILLDHADDPRPRNAPADPGTDLLLGGGAKVYVPGGILLSSTSEKAGDFGGQGTGQRHVYTPFTYIQGSGGHGALPDYVKPAWDNWYTNQSDSSLFDDPFEGKGQPPLTKRGLPPRAVPGGVLNTTICPEYVCPEGVYFATSTVNGVVTATGDQITFPNPQGSSPQWKFNSGAFGEFTFFGGLNLNTPNALKVDFGPGRYTMAGQNGSDGSELNHPPNSVFAAGNATTVTGGGMTGDVLNDAGRLFLLTDSTYPGLANQLSVVDSYLASAQGTRSWSQLNFGTSNFKAGDNASSSLSLYGLDKTKIDAVASDVNGLGYTLRDFGNIAIWQDQRNSNIKYNADGTWDTSCLGMDACANAPLWNRRMELNANQKSQLEGIVYQPRGASVEVTAGSNYAGPITLVSGALTVWGNGMLVLSGSLQPMTRRTAALVE